MFLYICFTRIAALNKVNDDVKLGFIEYLMQTIISLCSFVVKISENLALMAVFNTI